MTNKTHPQLEAAAQKAGLSQDEFIAFKKQKPYRELSELGFTNKQIKAMFEARTNRTDTCVPFQNTAIKQRYNDFLTVFQPYGMTPKQIREIISTGIMFSQDPRKYKILFQFIENNGCKVSDFLKITKKCNGLAVLSRSPNSVINNIKTMSKTLEPYGITPQKWIKMGIERPSLLKQTPDYLCSSINKICEYLEQYGFSKSDWIEAGILNVNILDREPKELIQKQKNMSEFLAAYNFKPEDWISACLNTPQLFYTPSKYIQQRFHFYINAYEAGDFIFTKLDKQDTSHLIRTLLTSSQYLCYGKKNLEIRQQYMEQQKKKNTVATSAVLYRTLGYLKKQMHIK